MASKRLISLPSTREVGSLPMKAGVQMWLLSITAIKSFSGTHFTNEGLNLPRGWAGGVSGAKAGLTIG